MENPSQRPVRDDQTVDAPPSSDSKARASVKDLFVDAAELSGLPREVFLRDKCGDDAMLRQEVEALLAAHDQAGPFLKQPSRAEAPGLSASPLLGTQIGRYKLLEIIGEGGFGTVYLAEQSQPIRRQVALKVIKLGMDTRQVIARFEAERQALAVMDHPNIAKVLDGGATEVGRPYFVMELINGTPITDYCDANHLSVSDRLELFTQVCRAIQHAHQKGIIHRDLKPSNVLVAMADGRPTPKVIDFGIAKAIDQRLTEKTIFTDFRQMIGTPQYMSPEQANNEGSDLDTRTDVFSLGVLLYELLVGATPFDPKELRSKAYGEMQRIIRDVDPPRPSTRLSALHDSLASVAACRKVEPGRLGQMVRGELDWIVMRAIEKSPARRYGTAEALAADIVRHLSGEAVTAAPPGRAYLIAKFGRRHRAALSVTVAFVILLIGSAVTSTILAARAHRAEGEIAGQLNVVQSERERAQASARLAENRLADGLEFAGDSFVNSGDAGRARESYLDAQAIIRRLGNSDLGNRAAILQSYTIDAPPLMGDDGGRKSIGGFDDGANSATCVAFAPDGRTAVSGGGDGSLTLWNVLTGIAIRRFIGHSGGIWAIAVSPDGRHILSSSLDNSTRLWDSATATELRRLPNDPISRHPVAFSPDGRGMLTGGGLDDVTFSDVATGAEIRRFANDTYVLSLGFLPDGHTVLTGSPYSKNILWDLNTGLKIRAFGEGRAYPVCISPDGRTVLCGDRIGGVTLWNIATGESIQRFPRQEHGDVQIAFAADGRTAVVGSPQLMSLLDVKAGTVLHTFTLNEGAISGVAIAPDGRSFLCASAKGLRLWDTTGAGERRELTTKTDFCRSVAVSPDGRTALAPRGGGLSITDLATGKELRRFTAPMPGSVAVAFAPDGLIAISLDDDNLLRYWDIASGAEVRRVEVAGHAHTAVFSPDRSALLGFGYEKLIRLYGTATGKELRRFTGQGANVRCMTFSPDGRSALTASGDTVKWWDVATGATIRTFAGNSSVAFSPNGRTALSDGPSHALALWDLDSGRIVRTLNGNAERSDFQLFSPDGRNVITASDGTLNIWDLNLEKRPRRVPAHMSSFFGALSPDGQGLLTRGNDQALKFWDFNRPSEYAEFEESLPRARAALAQNPNDPAALHTFGDWYAFRNRNDWAIEFLEKARAAGQEVSSLTMARCYWKLAKPTEARRELQYAIKRNEAPKAYLQLCLGGLEREAWHVAHDDADQYASDAKYQEAVDACTRAISADPSDHWAWCLRGCLIAFLGDGDAYRQNSRLMAERFADADETVIMDRRAKTALLMPDTIADVRALMNAYDARAAANPSNNLYRRYTLAKGMAEYRSGNPQECIDWMTKSLKLNLEPRAAITARLFVAMAHYQLAHGNEAVAALHEAMASIDRQRPIVGEPMDEVDNWLIMQVIAREAETLITSETSISRAATQPASSRPATPRSFQHHTDD